MARDRYSSGDGGATDDEARVIVVSWSTSDSSALALEMEVRVVGTSRSRGALPCAALPFAYQCILMCRAMCLCNVARQMGLCHVLQTLRYCLSKWQSLSTGSHSSFAFESSVTGLVKQQLSRLAKAALYGGDGDGRVYAGVALLMPIALTRQLALLRQFSGLTRQRVFAVLFTFGFDSSLLVNVVDKIALSNMPSEEQFRGILDAVEAAIGTTASHPLSLQWLATPSPRSCPFMGRTLTRRGTHVGLLCSVRVAGDAGMSEESGLAHHEASPLADRFERSQLSLLKYD